jgi:UDP-N-acetyl-D-glucosamine dehydrogenase
MPFYPGPGLGGHCIPIDPFYLTWKAREFDIATRFIELAGEINRAMPRYVVEALEKGLDRHFGLSLGSSRVLIVGLAYKRDVSDIRESPSLKLIELLEERGTKVDFHDPHVAEIPRTREYLALAGRTSVGLDPDVLDGYDGVVIATDHSTLDYALLSERCRLIVDTRNAIGSRGLPGANVVKA